MKIADHRTEFWLQVKHSKDWQDCGPKDTMSEIFKDIGQLKKANPNGQWRAVVRETIDYEVRRGTKSNRRKR